MELYLKITRYNKTLFALLFCFAFIPLLSAQRADLEEYCGSDQINETLLNNDAKQQGIFEKMNRDWENWALREITEKQKTGGANAKMFDAVTLPVVFHDLTSGGGLYASTNDFAGALGALNTNFLAEPNINFCLAEVDAFGIGFDESAGDSPVAVLDNNDMGQINDVSNVIQMSGRFPPTDYINIYVVDDIAFPVAGFAFLPNAHGASIDGIYIEAQYVTGGSPIVITHEMGHYLGLHHTFGRCQPIFEECSCTNDNCLLDGDMVCDTPPDFSTAPEPLCNAPNTCDTDANPLYNMNGDQLNPFAADFPGNSGPIDANDYIDNYMDYGNWDCMDSFTPGQADRMRFMIDEEVGPRNSLLNSTVCNPACDLGPNCKVVIDELPAIELLGVPYENTLELSGASVTHTFNGTINDCPGLTSPSWTITNLDTDQVTQTGTGMSIVGNFNATGNYRIEFTASSTGGTPPCERTATYDIQVVGTIANGGNCLDISWDDMERIEYTGGWVYNGTGPGSGMRDASSSGPVTLTGPNDTDNSSPFAVISGAIPGTDPTYGGTPLPNGLNDVFRVGRVIDGNNQNPLPDGAAYYTTYTFTPTEENNRLRVWYLGLREDLGSGSNSSLSNFANPGGTNMNGFGMVVSYQTSGGTFRGKTHNQSSFEASEFNNFLFENDNGFDNVDVDRTSFPINGQGDYEGMNDWGFLDLDLSMYVCDETEVTLTFYARTNSALNAFYHSYAYYGLQCLPGVPGQPIEFDLPNIYTDCSVFEGITCNTFTFDIFDADLIPRNMGQRLPNYFINMEIARSNDGVNFGPFENLSASQPTTSSPTLEFDLCTEGNANPVEHFRVRYITPCKTYEDDFALHQGFSHEIDPCPELDDEEPRGGEIPLGVSSEVFVCESATITLTKPCWWEDGIDITYRWQVFRNGSWRDFLGNGNEEVTLDASNLNSFPLDFSECSEFRRLANYEDPYCGVEVWISSELYSLTYSATTRPRISGNPLTNNVCLGEEISLYALMDSRSGTAACMDQSVENQLTIAIFDTDDNPVIGDFVTQGGTSLATNTHTYTYNYTGESEQSIPDLYFNFVNNSAVNFDIIIRAEGVAYDCPFSWATTATILVKESAIGGEIEIIPCTDPIHIGTINLDNNNDNGYTWEYSYNNVDWVTIPGEEEAEMTIPDDLDFVDYPVWVRRVANGTQDCPDIAYSNVVLLENEGNGVVPIFEQIGPICAGDPISPLPTTSLNGITGTWSPAVINNQMTTTYTFTPDEIYECAVRVEMTIVVRDCGGECIRIVLDSVGCASQGSNTPETCDDQWTFWITAFQGDGPGTFVRIYVDGVYQTATSYGNSKQVGFFDYDEYPGPVTVEVCDNEDPDCCETITVTPPPLGFCSPPPCTGFDLINYSVTCDGESMTICYDVVGTNGACWATSVKTNEDPEDHGVHLNDGFGDQTGVCHTVTGDDLEEILAYDDDHIILWGMICETFNNSDCEDAPDEPECVIDIVVPYECNTCGLGEISVGIECVENQTTLTAYLDGVVVNPNFYEVEWQVADMVFPNSQNPLTVYNEYGSEYAVTITLRHGDDSRSCFFRGEIRCNDGDHLDYVVYPNPSGIDDLLNVRTLEERNLGHDVTFQVTNELGLVVFEDQQIVEESNLLQRFAPGTYYLRVINHTTGTTSSLRFQVFRR